MSKKTFQFYPPRQYCLASTDGVRRWCIGLNSTEGLCCQIRHYMRKWDKMRSIGIPFYPGRTPTALDRWRKKWEKIQQDRCCHPDQKLIARVCWLQSQLLNRFKSGEALPRNVLQYLVGYKIVACVLLGKRYVA